VKYATAEVWRKPAKWARSLVQFAACALTGEEGGQPRIVISICSGGTPNFSKAAFFA
jgi:hypothetical protein